MASNTHPDEGDTALPKPFHRYTFGSENIDWVRWVNGDIPVELNFPGEIQPSEKSHCSSHNTQNESRPALTASALESLSTENGTSAAVAIEQDANSDTASDYVDSVTEEVLSNNDEPVQNPDMSFLKLLALKKYPGTHFVHLMPFQSWLNRLPKGHCLAILTQIWNLQPVATPTSTTVPTVTAEHPDATIQTKLAIPSDNIQGQVNTVDLIGMLHARDVNILRGDVVLALRQVDGETILRYMVPNGLNTAQIERLYFCAVLFGTAVGHGFGFDCQAWLDRFGAFVPLPPEHELELPNHLRWMTDWPDFEKQSWD